MTYRLSNTFIPYGKQTINQEDIDSVLSVLKSEFLTQGPKVPEFEETLCDITGGKYAVAVNSATSALHIACIALGLGKDDIAWTSSTTFVASANCIRYCGADVDFVDINPSTGLMDIDLLEKKLITAKGEDRLPKIVIPVHLAGSCCDMQRLYMLSNKYNFFIIEDASHAVGGSYRNSMVGKCEYSDITIFSFHPVKIITTGEGGAALTNRSELAERMRLLRSHGITKDKTKFTLDQKDDWVYEQQDLGFNYRMTDIQAALGTSQLKRLKSIIEERNRLYLEYIKLFKSSPINMIKIPDKVRSSVHLGICQFKEMTPDQYRKLFKKMREQKIGVQLHYLPVHLQPYYRKLGFKEGDFSNSESYCYSNLSIPLFPGLEQQDMKYIASTMIDIYNDLNILSR